MRRVLLAGSCVVVAVLLACGCSVRQQDGDDGAVGRFDDPFDLPLEGMFVDLALYGAAVDTVIAECMERAGLGYPVGTLDLGRPAVLAQSALGYPNLTPELVETYGYRAPRDPRVVVPAPSMATVVPPGEDERYTQAKETCTDESRGLVPDIAEPGNVLLRLDAESREAPLDDPRVAASVNRWRECVTRADPVLGDRGGSPEEFRVSVLMAVDVRDHEGEPDTMTFDAPPDEIEAATVDVACRSESGHDDAYFTAVGEAQEHLVSQNAAAVESARQSMDDIQQAIDRYVVAGR